MHNPQTTATPKPSKTASGRELHACMHTKQSRTSALTFTKTDMQIGNAAMKHLKNFITGQQMKVISEFMRGEEGQFFIDKMLELSNIVITMPVTYQTDGQGMEAVAHLHYFVGGADWYITERDMETEQLQAFGLADLGYGGELGYISIVELLECGAELDLHWTPKKLAEI